MASRYSGVHNTELPSRAMEPPDIIVIMNVMNEAFKKTRRLEQETKIQGRALSVGNFSSSG